MSSIDTQPVAALLERHRYLTIKHALPERLELAARTVLDAVGCVRLYGLADAFTLPPSACDELIEDLMDAAARIRAAAALMPAPVFPHEQP